MASKIEGENRPLKLSTLFCCNGNPYVGGDAVKLCIGELPVELFRETCMYAVELDAEFRPKELAAGLGTDGLGTLDVRGVLRDVDATVLVLLLAFVLLKMLVVGESPNLGN